MFFFSIVRSVSLLEDRVTRLHGQLQRTQQHLMASSDPGSVDRKVLDDLYEDIHWLILVSGQLLLLPPLEQRQRENFVCSGLSCVGAV